MRALALALCLVLSVVGCGAKVGPSEDPIVREERFINGKPVADYYRQFLYRKVDNEALPFRYLSNAFTKIKKIDDNKTLYFTASIFLLEDGTYVLDYEEAIGEKSDDGFITVTTDFKTRVKGAWRIEDLALVLDGIGKAAGFVKNEKDAIALKFEKVLHAPELNGTTDYFYYTSSNQGLED